MNNSLNEIIKRGFDKTFERLDREIEEMELELEEMNKTMDDLERRVMILKNSRA